MGWARSKQSVLQLIEYLLKRIINEIIEVDMQVGMQADMLVVHAGLVDRLVVHPGVVADRLVLVADRRAVRADCTLVLGRQSVEDMQEHRDIVDLVVQCQVHQVKEHQDTGLLCYHQLVGIEGIDEELDNQGHLVAVVDKHGWAEGDMRTVVELVDRLELVPALVMVLLVSPMMLF